LYEYLFKEVAIYYSGQTKETAQIKAATSIQRSYLLKLSGEKKKEASSFLQTQGKIIGLAIDFKAQPF